MLVRLAKLPRSQRQRWNISSLRQVLHGAAPTSAAVKRDMINWWGPLLTEYWGATESGVCTVCSTEQWLQHPGTVGLPLPQWQVFAVDAVGQELAPGQEGMLYARHQSLAQPFSYWNDAAKTARAYRGPGEITLGDYGRVDASGYVYIAARGSDLIIGGGVNIYPAEVEAVLLLHPAVQDACVFGRDDPEWGFVSMPWWKFQLRWPVRATISGNCDTCLSKTWRASSTPRAWLSPPAFPAMPRPRCHNPLSRNIFSATGKSGTVIAKFCPIYGRHSA